MARQKRSTLPPVTEADLAHSPERIRSTGKGWAWKCAYCGQFASSETIAGKYVCRSHGGVTPRQRDPVAYAVAKQNLKPLPRPPGRPPVTGRWSKRNLLQVDQIFEDYKARRLDPDDTDDDMLYLRAMLDWQKKELVTLKEAEMLLRDIQLLSTKATSHTEEELHALKQLCKEINLLVSKRLALSRRLEKGHERLVKLAKIRAETRLKNSAARQVGAFRLMVERLTTIFEEVLPPELHYALQLRFEKELKELPSVVG